jgi:tRNA threonylcarbamoyl adenosine modification protein YeaZ
MPALALSGSNLAGDAPFSCALRLPTGVFVARSPAGTRGDLATLVANLCRDHDVGPADLRELRIDLGPGSYTGLRVAITFVRFLQQFGELPVLACDSLMLLASAHTPTQTHYRVRPLLDARRNRFHVATVVHDATGLHHAIEPAAIALEAVLASLQENDRILTSPLVVPQIEARATALGATVETIGAVDAGSLFAANLPLERCASAQLEPRYLMGSYAEA